MVLVPAVSRPVEQKVCLAGDYLHREEAGRDQRHSSGKSCSMLSKVSRAPIKWHTRAEK